MEPPPETIIPCSTPTWAIYKDKDGNLLSKERVLCWRIVERWDNRDGTYYPIPVGITVRCLSTPPHVSCETIDNFAGYATLDEFRRD